MNKGSHLAQRTLYLCGQRVPCVFVDAALAMIPTADFDIPLAASFCEGDAAEGWLAVTRGYARPHPAEPRSLVPLNETYFAAMRGLHGLYAGRFPGMFAREYPFDWDALFASLHHPMGIVENDLLLLWLDSLDGCLTELSAAPDACALIPGALAAAGIVRAPAPILGIAPEAHDTRIQLRLLRPFRLSGVRIDTLHDLQAHLRDAVQWDADLIF